MKPDEITSRKVQIAAALTYWVVQNIDLTNRLTDPRLFNFEASYSGNGHRTHRGESKELYGLVCEQMPIELLTTEFKAAMDLLSEGSIATVLHNRTDFSIVSLDTNVNMDRVKESRHIRNRDIPLMSEKYPVFSRILGENLEVIMAEITEIARLQKIYDMADRSDVTTALETGGLAAMLDRLDNAAVMGKVVILSPEDTTNIKDFIVSAQDIIRSSNMMPPEQKAEHLAHFEALLNLVEKVKSVAAGTLKYLFVDRLRGALDGLIEDVYKDAVVYLLGIASAFALSRI